MVFGFDGGYLYQPPPPRVVVEREVRVVEVERFLPEEREELLSQVISRGGTMTGRRLDALRTQAARDYRRHTPMPYDTFDSMSSEERCAYGEEWDRLMIVGGRKGGPFFKKKWR